MAEDVAAAVAGAPAAQTGRAKGAANNRQSARKVFMGLEARW